MRCLINANENYDIGFGHSRNIGATMFFNYAIIDHIDKKKYYNLVPFVSGFGR